MLASLWLAGLVATPANAAMLLHIEAVTPRIAQRGTTVTVLIQGVGLHSPREIIFYKPGIKAIKLKTLPKLPHARTLAHGGRMEEQLQATLEIAANCAIGEHPFRLRTATEISSLGTFHVSPFPVVDEDEHTQNANDTLETARAITPNMTVRGRIGGSTRGDIDVYRVPAVAGNELSVEVDSVRIADIHYSGAEFDLAVRILDEAGQELATNDDNPLHLQDPVASVKLPRSGVAYVEVRRSVFMPADTAYAVHIGQFRRPLVAYPAGGQVGTQQQVQLRGDALGVFTKTLSIPNTSGTFEYLGDAPSGLPLRASLYPNVLEDRSSPITHVKRLPAALNGSIDVRGDSDVFRVAVDKMQRWRVRVYAAALGSAIDPRLRIRRVDAHGQLGKVELEADDADLPERDIFGTSFRSGGGLKDRLDPSVIWEPTASGDYSIEIEDSTGRGGPTAVYRIEVEPASDSVFTLLQSRASDWQENLRASGLAIPVGNRWAIDLSLPQGQGSKYRDGLTLVASGLPHGVQLIASPVPPGQSHWPVQFVADATARPGAALIALEAQPIDPTKHLISGCRQVLPFVSHAGGDAMRTVQLAQYVVAVTDPAPFSVELQTPSRALVRGTDITLPVKVTRNAGFDDEPLELFSDWAPPGIAVQPSTTLTAHQTEAEVRIAADHSAPLGKIPWFIAASTTRATFYGYLGTGQQRVSSNMVELTITDAPPP